MRVREEIGLCVDKDQIEGVVYDLAIKFAEWMFINYPNQYKLYQYKDEKRFYTTKQLLEIYKKQKQL